MKQFLGPSGEKEGKVKVGEGNTEKTEESGTKRKVDGQWPCTGDIRYDESRGPVFPRQWVVAAPGVWETRHCMWL